MQHGLQLVSSGSWEREAVSPGASSMKTLFDLYLNLLYNLHTCDPETSNPFKIDSDFPSYHAAEIKVWLGTELDPKENEHGLFCGLISGVTHKPHHTEPENIFH